MESCFQLETLKEFTVCIVKRFWSSNKSGPNVESCGATFQMYLQNWKLKIKFIEQI